MTTDTLKLKSALDNLRPIISRRNTLPILSCVKLHTERNRLHISATNLDEFVVEKIEVDGEIEPVCVSFNYLYMALSGAVVDINISNGGAQIKCGDNETNISTMDAEEFPQFPEFKNPENHGVACADLSNSVKQVDWASSDDPTRYILNSVLISSSAKKLITVATNGREMALVEKAIIGSDYEILVPREFTSNFSNVLSRAGAVLSSTKNQIKVGHDSGVYFCKQMEGVYPNWRNVIPASMKSLGSVAVDEFMGVIASCIGYSNHSEAKGLFKFSKKEMEIEFVGDNSAKLSRHMMGSFQPLTIALSTKKLHKIFQNIKTDEAKIFYVDEISVIKIESGDLSVLTTPMRIS